MAKRENIEYSAYPRPAPSPIKRVVKVSLSVFEKTPVTKIKPIKARSSAIILGFVNLSLKQIADMIITNAGAVYRRIAATESDVIVISLK